MRPRSPLHVSALAHRVLRIIHQSSLVTPGARIVVGVSGGPDSVALLALLAELRAHGGWRLWAVSVNHGWRPAAARRAQTCVGRVGALLGVPVRLVTIAPRKRPRHSWEGTAREARYAALLREARRVRATTIAVAHTEEDQAETVLLALLRGTGLRGAGGMPPVRAFPDSSVRLIRPLLTLRHAPLRAYLRHRRLPWVVDATNHDQRFRRNAVRHSILPRLTRSYGAQVVHRLAVFADLARGDDAVLEDQVARWCRRHARVTASGIRVSLRALRRQPVAIRRRVIRWAWHQVAGSMTRLTFRHVAACVELAARDGRRAQRGRVALPGGIAAGLARSSLVVTCATPRRML